ncbi:ChbG/HpnK family deacetylase [Pusillimonas sp.]|uniref:ChbG/HpnK family deacetylase n=1 Tax=Pusillimonas sp. TaxID=3040095 RepID=UPI0037C82E28
MNVDSQTKSVVFCADDFGMNPAVDTGIIRLARQGRLSAASCLTQGPTFSAHALELAKTGVQLGLHLNFTEPLGRACMRTSSDKTQELYLPLPQLIRRAYLRRLDRNTLRAQIQNQLDSFEEVFNRPPHFVDGHQHIHQLPVIRDVLLDTLLQRYRNIRPPWLRGTHAIPLRGPAAAYRTKALIIQALGAGVLARGARKAGFSLNARFAGVYDFQGGETAYRDLLAAWLRQIGDRDVFMCHPAAHVDKADPLGPQRLAEFNVLSGDEMGRWLQEHKIQPLLDAF